MKKKNLRKLICFNRTVSLSVSDPLFDVTTNLCREVFESGLFGESNDVIENVFAHRHFDAERVQSFGRHHRGASDRPVGDGVGRTSVERVFGVVTRIDVEENLKVDNSLLLLSNK